MMAEPGLASLNWSGQEQSIITYAQTGAAVISKAAGNDAVVIGGTNKGDRVDYLNIALVGAQSAIFVGALYDPEDRPRGEPPKEESGERGDPGRRQHGRRPPGRCPGLRSISKQKKCGLLRSSGVVDGEVGGRDAAPLT